MQRDVMYQLGNIKKIAIFVRQDFLNLKYISIYIAWTLAEHK